MAQHEPQAADHELRKAYYAAVELGLLFFWDRRAIPGVSPDEALAFYRRAFKLHREGSSLAAERWARTAKHLTRAFAHEAKIAYLEPAASELPYLDGATPVEYRVRETHEVVTDLLNSVAEHIPPGMTELPEDMRRYLTRAYRHLATLDLEDYRHELLRAERVNAAYEYGRVLELMALAYEAESRGQAPTPPPPIDDNTPDHAA